MKITINKDILLKKLSVAYNFTSQQISSAPSLKGIKILFENKKLQLFSSNLHDYYSTTIQTISGEEKIECIIDAKKIIEFLQYVQDEIITIEKSDTKLHIYTKISVGEFILFKEKDFPEWPMCDGDKIEIEEKIIKYLPFIIFSASKDDSRPVLTSILFNPKEEENNIVSTDGFRMSLYTYKSNKNSINKVMISSKFLQYILSTLKEKKLTCIFSKDNKLIEVVFENDHFISRVIEGEYPPYEKVIPDKTTTIIRVDREEFITNLKLMSVFAREKSNIMIFDIKKKEFIIRPKQEATINSNVKQQTLYFEGEEIQIAFNYQFLVEYLANNKSQVVEMRFATPTSPGIFCNPEEQEYIHVIMPLRIQEN